MAVEVGSFSDSAAMPGLAHYLEHMLFMVSLTLLTVQGLWYHAKILTVFFTHNTLRRTTHVSHLTSAHATTHSQ